MRSFLFLVLCAASLALFADARFVEAPAECHFPYDNNNVGNEHKAQSCAGIIKTHPDGAVASAFASVEQDGVPGGLLVLNGEDVRDQEAYPGGVLTVVTSGTASGTNCSIIDAGGTTYQTSNWEAITKVTRTSNAWDVDVLYRLTCWGGVAQ